MLQLTPVVRNIIIVNVIVFFLQLFFGGVNGPLTRLLSLWNVGTEGFEPYQLFTYMFAHSSFGHIFFNMLILAFAGPILENYWGQNRFLLFYLVTGIGAGVFNMGIDYFFLNGQSFGYMLGASGAVYGVLMGFGIIFPNMELLLLFVIPIKAKYLVFILGALAIYNSYSNAIGIGGPGDNVAHLAHLGGMIFAFIMIQIWKKQGGRGGYF
ncbi:MAG: rhomboid family intramembrane serine protease [Flammeovirgaceae bacterium]|jgi:membrane associated rhomboid family serine protease|nr:rhomboid family intramembrane serine protease [Flammeovirgaceae bacterium]